ILGSYDAFVTECFETWPITKHSVTKASFEPRIWTVSPVLGGVAPDVTENVRGPFWLGPQSRMLPRPPTVLETLRGCGRPMCLPLPLLLLHDVTEEAVAPEHERADHGRPRELMRRALPGRLVEGAEPREARILARRERAARERRGRGVHVGGFPPEGGREVGIGARLPRHPPEPPDPSEHDPLTGYEFAPPRDVPEGVRRGAEEREERARLVRRRDVPRRAGKREDLPLDVPRLEDPIERRTVRERLPRVGLAHIRRVATLVVRVVEVLPRGQRNLSAHEPEVAHEARAPLGRDRVVDAREDHPGVQPEDPEPRLRLRGRGVEGVLGRAVDGAADRADDSGQGVDDGADHGHGLGRRSDARPDRCALCRSLSGLVRLRRHQPPSPPPPRPPKSWDAALSACCASWPTAWLPPAPPPPPRSAPAAPAPWLRSWDTASLPPPEPPP